MQDINNTLEERGSKYGTIYNNARTTQGLMRVLEHAPNYHLLTDVHKECLHMIMHKVSRMVCGDTMYSDNPHDIGGYAKLLEEWMVNLNDEC